MQKMMDKPEGTVFRDNEMRHGLGLIFNRVDYQKIQTGDIICHGGATRYHHSRFQFDPELGLGIAVMTNTERGARIAESIVNKVFLEYLKILDTPKTENQEESKETITDLHEFEGEYVGSNRHLQFKYSKHKRLESRINFLRFHIVLREDGFFNTYPLGIARLPRFSKILKSMSLKFNKLNDSTVLYIKYQLGPNVVTVPAAVPYKKQTDLSLYKDLIGKYFVSGPIEECKNAIEKVSINVKDGNVYLSLKMATTKVKFYLQAIDRNTFITQGIGRYSGDTITFTKTNKEVSALFYGVEFKKSI